MNLSPEWCKALEAEGFEAVHWSAVGDPRATDASILAWAHSNQHIVLTKDLDFGAILAVSHASAPSVLQVRAHDVTPDHLRTAVVLAIRRYGDHLRRGALISFDETSHRARILPLRD